MNIKKVKKPFYKRWWFILIALFFLLGIAGAFNDDKNIESASKKEIVKEEKTDEVIKEEPKERQSEYSETEKPWGEFNYKNAGVIKDITKDLENNYTIATLITDNNTENKVKIYGTDMDISNYNSKKVFLSGTKSDDLDKDYILVSNYKNINLVDENLITSINNLDNIDNTSAVTAVDNSINGIDNEDYKNYMRSFYNVKISSLNQKKEDEQRKIAEEQARQQELQRQQEAERQRKAQEQQNINSTNKNQTVESVPGNGETVYVASSGEGECYHSKPNCGRMKSAYSMTKSEAEGKGYRPCKKCY
ncbi:hypothetical protein [uncultured Clostridium sp.]|uniref:hypothetical protein n=1 Tax=uncultured Clostridium sp. TaxID=59620 RepID=UPI0025F9EEBD|nr:hypothetical protein [uncultured Clostridium sp.]